jgi:hypothetical protein
MKADILGDHADLSLGKRPRTRAIAGLYSNRNMLEKKAIFDAEPGIPGNDTMRPNRASDRLIADGRILANDRLETETLAATLARNRPENDAEFPPDHSTQTLVGQNNLMSSLRCPSQTV